MLPSIQYYFCLRSHKVMPINGNANDIITTFRPQNKYYGVTMTNTYTLPLKAMEELF
jgi:hypothetical protein